MPICDGIRYDEVSAFPIKLQKILVARKLVWLTSFQEGATGYGGSVIAASRDEAEKIADARGLGEQVDGYAESYVDPPYLPDKD
jgi:hypothetical protein